VLAITQKKKSEQKTNHLFYIQYPGQRAKQQLLATLHLCYWGWRTCLPAGRYRPSAFVILLNCSNLAALIIIFGATAKQALVSR